MDLLLCAFILGNSLVPRGRDAREKYMRKLKLTQKSMLEGRGAENDSTMNTERVICKQLISVDFIKRQLGI